MAQVIDIAADETVAAIRSKMLAATEKRIILAVARGTKALQSPVGPRVIARTAQEFQLEVAIVTVDGMVRDEAERAGFSVFRRIKQAEAAKRWRTPGPTKTTAAPRPHPSVALGQNPSRRSWAEHLLAALLILILLAAFGAASVLLIPEANIELVPARKNLAAEVRVAVVPDQKDIDYAKVSIPGRKLTTIVQGTWSQPTTSRKDQPEGRATGTVTFVNQAGLPITIPSGTIVSTGAGVPVRFRTTADVQLPSGRGATIQAPVEALDAGPQGNVGAYLINTVLGTQASQVSVINEQPTQGGSVRQVGMVTQADKDRLENGLLQRLEAEAHTALQNSLQPGEIAPRETLSKPHILGKGFDHMNGDTADQVSLTIRVEYSELAFKASDAQRMALAGLRGAVPAGYRLLDEGMDFQVASAEVDAQGGLLLDITASGVAQATLDPAQVRSLVLGRTPEEAQARLDGALPLAEPARISLTPPWSTTLPRFPFRIGVNIGS